MKVKVKENAEALNCLDKELLEMIANSLECVCECECKEIKKNPCLEPSNNCGNK